MAYDQKTLENLLFKSKISGIPSNNELRASVEEILSSDFEVKEGDASV